MAAATPSARAAPAGSGTSFMQFVIALVVVTILAGAVGAVFSSRLAPAPKDATPQNAADQAPGGAANAPTSNVLDLPPIVTNLGAPQEMWVRLEASMIFDSSAVQHPETIAAEIANDLLAYMRSVSVTQIQGPIGLQNLRQDLNERAAIRSNGAVKELVIKTLVLQ
jgi:flagellar protein FliL